MDVSEVKQAWFSVKELAAQCKVGHSSIYYQLNRNFSELESHLRFARGRRHYVEFDEFGAALMCSYVAVAKVKPAKRGRKQQAAVPPKIKDALPDYLL